MESSKKSGLYIHFPVCRQKCIYCDFFSAGEKAVNKAALEVSLLAELRVRWMELPYPPTTIYLGGGTPSLMPPESIGRILDTVRDTYPGIESEEITMEVNPDDVTEELAEKWSSFGINRISMGVQSLQDNELKAVGRRHTAEKTRESMEILKKFFKNISLDLIFGLPQQTMESWKESVEGILDLRPNHISAYALMLEPGTAMKTLAKTGRVTLPEEGLTEDMFRYLTRRLRVAGYIRYETSNYALPGFESRHNNLYWHGAPYLGLGPSAHSYDGRYIRRWNPADLHGYLRYFNGEHNQYSSDGTSFFEEERLSEEELREEYILTRMRLAEGISLADYRDRFGEGTASRLIKNAQKDICNCRLVSDNGRIYLSESGVMTEDDVIVNLSL